jgi:tetratricopeptide (TPR) repeat protein
MMSWPSRRTLVIAIAIAVGVLIVGGAATVWYTTGQRAASGAYAAALTNAQRSGAAGGDPAAAATRLEETLARYPSARRAADAAYELGNLRYAQRQYPTARRAYEVALAKRPTATIRILSRAGVGYTWEAEGDFGKAVDAFNAGFTSLKPGEFLYEQLGLDLARAQELAGQRDAAIGTYRKLLKDLPKTSRGEDIRARLASLGDKP